jgi:hypothetical protein
METENIPSAEQSAVAAASDQPPPLPAPKAPPACLTPTPPVPVFAASQRHADSPRYTFKFGTKHKGKDYADVTEEDPGYFFWATDQKTPSPVLQHYINWVYSHYEVDADGRSLINPSKLGMYVADTPSPTAPHPSIRLNSTRQLKKEWSQTPKCQPYCRPPFSFKGSNAFVRKETCYKYADSRAGCRVPSHEPQPLRFFEGRIPRLLQGLRDLCERGAAE